MEKLAGFEKNRKWFALPIHSKRRRKSSWKTVSVHYEGSLGSGFDSSYPRKPIEFPLGQGNVRMGRRYRFIARRKHVSLFHLI
jgi:hypothetical protein